MKNKNLLWVGVGVAIAAAATALYFWTKGEKKEKPPKKAPQLKINNPGEQSEFQTTATESEIG